MGKQRVFAMIYLSSIPIVLNSRTATPISP